LPKGYVTLDSLDRIRAANTQPCRPDGDYVLLWLIASRRLQWNFALQRAVRLTREYGKPLVVFEALRCGYPWACDRFHRFILDGMRDNAADCAKRLVSYYPYVEPWPDHGKGLLSALAARACAVITDDFPAFFLPRMVLSAARQVPVRLELVDSNGILPLACAGKAFPTAYAFRRFFQASASRSWPQFPDPDPLLKADLQRLGKFPEDIVNQWPPVPVDVLQDPSGLIANLPIDHAVPATTLRGGRESGVSRMWRFLDEHLAHYADRRNHPDLDACSGLSPFLHFGHVSAHQVFAELMAREGWSEALLPRQSSGSRSGWWRVSPSAEAFLDQLIIWRELGYNTCRFRPDYDQYESLPAWARETLEIHAPDRRPYQYSSDELEQARTHDSLWNAAQKELVAEGRMHNYLRMVWGKKILEWTPSPRVALDVMIHLNNKYALDGRNPNSYTGIFWVLGRYDRAWGPERPVFGKIRYMSTANTQRKVQVKQYLKRFAPDA
jgi:deoxyribodipyrimidine photo-lyase